MAPAHERPSWWDWELQLSGHVLKRMVDRGITEVDLRSMMSTAMSVREDREPGRWIVAASHESRLWEVIVEPDPAAQLVAVITAYSVEAP